MPNLPSLGRHPTCNHGSSMSTIRPCQEQSTGTSYNSCIEYFVKIFTQVSAVYEHKLKVCFYKVKHLKLTATWLLCHSLKKKKEFSSNFVEITTQYLRFDHYCELLSSDFVGGVNFFQLHKYKLALSFSLVFFEWNMFFGTIYCHL